jgi:hypothetical protein
MDRKRRSSLKKAKELRRGKNRLGRKRGRRFFLQGDNRGEHR